VQQDDPRSLLNTLRHMIHARKGQPVLADGALHWLNAAPPAVLAFWRGEGTETFLALHNLADATVTTPLGPFANREMTDVLTGRNVALGERFTLEPYAYHWLKPAEQRG